MDFNVSVSAFATGHRAIPLDRDRVYDVIILGGGPAAMTAAVYCMRKGVSTALVARQLGGQVGETSGIENYLGYNYIGGMELVQKFSDHVRQFDIAIGEQEIVERVDNGTLKEIHLSDGTVCRAKAIIIATGTRWRKLNVPGEDRLLGRGVAYCAICDAPLFAGKEVAVVGGGNSGVEAAIDLARIAKRVTVVQNLDRLTADGVLVSALSGFGNVEALYGHAVEEIKGGNSVESVVVKSLEGERRVEIPVSGIFIEIGLMPNADMVKGAVELNRAGEIVVDCACRTGAPGIFAAGDVTSVPYKQIIIAAGEGAKAALSACEYVMKGG